MACRRHAIRYTAQLSYITRRNVQTQARYDYVQHHEEEAYRKPAGLVTPRQLVQYLDEYIIGQDQAKKVLSVAVFNHYNRVRAHIEAVEREQEDEPPWADASPDDPQSGVSGAHIRPYRLGTNPTPFPPRTLAPLFEKSNVLVIGPTGSGKTLLAKTLAKVMDVPFSTSDATSFTQAGYVGEDVDMAIHRLLQAANWDPVKASTGIVYIDEVDKVARKSGGTGTEGSRDVGGEGVQQALLRMMEGSIVSIQNKAGAMAEPPPMGADGRVRPGQRNPSLAAAPKPDTYYVDTTNVLFILSGAFVGLDNIIKSRLSKGSIGFTANLPSFQGNNGSKLPFFTSNSSPARSVLELVDTSDLVKYGFIPEFVSRMPSITTLSPLSVADLRRILTEVKGSLISQYNALFGYSGVEIRFTAGALDEICQKAVERGGGARGLRGIMENLLLEPMYETPGSNIRHVLITEATVRGEAPPRYWRKGEGASFWKAWADAESIDAKPQ